jgi:hypothetical protein
VTETDGIELTLQRVAGNSGSVVTSNA